MKFSNILFLLFIGLIFSCAEPEPKEVQLFNEKMSKTVAIHDEVMPEMTKLTQLIGELDAKMDSTNIQVYKPVIVDLKIGHDKMMSWMKDFGDEFSRTEINQGIALKNVDSIKSRLKLLEESQRAAQDMRDHVLEAIKNAETLIEEN